MAPTLYYWPPSPPCRSVRLLAKAINLELELVNVDPLKGETRTPKFVKINPQHTVPTLVDGDVVLWESRAILQYLANKYGTKEAMYPKEATQRALVDRLLYFDLGNLYLAFIEFAFPVAFGSDKPSPEKLLKVHESLQLLDQYLEGHFFAISNRMTIADHALVASVSTMDEVGIDMLKYSNVKRWLERCKVQMPGYQEINGGPAEAMGKMMKTKLRI